MRAGSPRPASRPLGRPRCSGVEEDDFVLLQFLALKNNKQLLLKFSFVAEGSFLQKITRFNFRSINSLFQERLVIDN